MTAERGENFIPWEQIEPLVEPGMTLRQLARLVVARAGLPYPAYRMRIKNAPPFVEALRRGVVIAKYSGHLPEYPDEVIA